MPGRYVIGLAVSHHTAYNRSILRAICRWAESRPHWGFVSLNPQLDSSTCESLKHVDAAVVEIHTADFRRKLPSRLPVVDIIDLIPHRIGLRVANDNDLISQAAAGHFLDRRVRSIGYVGEGQYYFSVERERVLRASSEAGDCEFHVLNFPAQDYDLLPMSFLRFPNTLLRDWLLSLPRPTGILSPCDVWGVEILQACHDVGLRVPEDISVLGVDDDELACQMARPRMSSAILSTEAIGRRAVASIEAQLKKRPRRDFRAEEVLFPPLGIAVRRSTDVLAIDNADVVAAVRFIRDNCHRPITVADVLQEVAVSRRWLERHLRDALGITINGEIRRTKVEFAKRLLLQTNDTIAQVAQHSGFSDVRHIEYAFQKELGLSPNRFRQQARG